MNRRLPKSYKSGNIFSLEEMENSKKRKGYRIKVFFLLLFIMVIALSSFYYYDYIQKSSVTYEEELRIHPPPPRNFGGVLMQDYIELHWDVPETVNVSHNYSDIISHYNIYRGTRIEDISYLTSTSDLIFKDFNISGSSQYIYEVTAVHEGSTESVPSSEVIISTVHK